MIFDSYFKLGGVAMGQNICGQRIKVARLRKDMKQVDVAVALEDYEIYLNQTAVGKMERGERNVYDYEILALSKVLEVSNDWLLQGGNLKID